MLKMLILVETMFDEVGFSFPLIWFVKMLLKEYAEYYEIIEVLFNYLYDRGNSVVTE